MTKYFVDENQKKKLEEEEREEKEDLDFEEMIFTNFNPDARKIFEDLKKNDQDFEKKIENILSKLQGSDDLIQIQSEILLLIKESYGEIQAKDPDLESEFDNKKSKKILKHIRDLSKYLINQKSKTSRDLTKDLNAPKDKYQYLSSESLNNLRAIIRRFIIYEIYKVVNPHRIAGETRKQTFIHNVILRGMEQARHFEGGTEAEIKTYGERMIRNLEAKHKSFTKTRNLFR